MNWQPVNLNDVDGAIEPPQWSGLVYRGRRHWFSGEPETAKTLVAYVIALEVARAGERVALIDFEMGQADAKTRLVELGATEHDFERIDFYEPDAKPAAGTLERIAERVALAIFDASAGAYELAGLDENRDAEKFNALYIRPLWKLGVATIVLDHVVKNSENRGRFASGHHRKIGGTDVHLGFVNRRPLSRGGEGQVEIVSHKDRPGYHGRGPVANVTLASDPATHHINWTIAPATRDTTDPDAWKPTRLMEKVSRYLEQHPDGVNRTNLYNGVAGKRQYLSVAVDELLNGGHATEMVPGAKGTKIRILTPYREEPFPPQHADNPSSEAASARTVPTVPDGSPPFPEPRRAQPFPPFPPLQGGTGTGTVPTGTKTSRSRPHSTPTTTSRFDGASRDLPSGFGAA